MKIFSQIILVVWLCTLFFHSSHGLNNETIQQSQFGDTETFFHLGTDVDCHLCYSSLDNVEYIDLIGPYVHLSSFTDIAVLAFDIIHLRSFQLPQLRAPPLLAFDY